MEPKSSYQVKASSTSHSNEDEDDYELQPITFSCYRQDPEAYLRWEEDLEAWFQAYQIPVQEKMSYAIDSLTEQAYKLWEKEEAAKIYYNEPTHNCESLKVEVYEEFVQKDQPPRQYIHQ